jgi:hypothetical protein
MVNSEWGVAVNFSSDSELIFLIECDVKLLLLDSENLSLSKKRFREFVVVKEKALLCVDMFISGSRI